MLAVLMNLHRIFLAYPGVELSSPGRGSVQRNFPLLKPSWDSMIYQEI